MAEEEGEAARAAWRDEHRISSGGREVLAARRAGGGQECCGNYLGARWAGPRRSEELVKSWSPNAGMGVARAGAQGGPGSMRAGAEVARPGCAGCDRA